MGGDESSRHFRIDVEKMHHHAAGFPDQVEWMWKESEGFKPGFEKNKDPLVICGMGGSAIGGWFLKDLAGPDSRAPVYLNRGYGLPPYLGKDARVICISYSGNTEETISGYNRALSRNCNVAVVTSGGRLLDDASGRGVPLLKLPEGLPPRAAIGYLFAALLRIGSGCGFVEVDEQDLNMALAGSRSLVEKYRIEGDPSGNLALRLARKLYGKLPLIYSGGGLMSGMAYRWKCQFNENAKTMAFDNIFPELGHNEIMGWECPDKFRENFFMVLLTDQQDHPRVKLRMEVSRRMLEPLAGGISVIDSDKGGKGLSRLSRLFSMLLLGDFASIYLAVEYGKDPTPVKMIEQVKEELRMEDQ